MKKSLLIFIVIILVVGGGVFYSGMKYQENKTPQGFIQRQQSSQERQERIGKGVGPGSLIGEVIAKDEQSLTLKMPEGGSKIVFFSDSTEITKSEKGSSVDLGIGKTVMINGKTNSDGSVTAETIQIRPEELNPPRQ